MTHHNSHHTTAPPATKAIVNASTSRPSCSFLVHSSSRMASNFPVGNAGSPVLQPNVRAS